MSALRHAKVVRLAAVAAAVVGLWCAMVGEARAHSCEATDCSTVRCDPRITEDSCRGEFRRNGALCWCCDACILYAEDNESCPRAVTLGVPPDAVCRPPLQCVEGICRRPARH